MLQLSGVGKSFGPLAALSDVSLAVASGEIHGLLGENGAGKTTLMRVLLGLERPDRGRILVDGVERHITSPAHARALGIGMVHQHFALVPTLDSIDNLALALGRGLGPLDRAGIQAQAAAAAAGLGWSLPPSRPVAGLAVGERQRLEILKALLGGGRVLVLDEPTAPLTPAEAQDLFRAMRQLAAQGSAIIFITHKLNEVEAVCARLTILRRGRVVHAGPLAGLGRARIAQLMVGTEVTAATSRASAPPGAVQLACAGVSLRGEGGEGVEAGEPALTGIELAVRAGEIVGIAGVDGNGQSELVRTLLGLERRQAGSVTMLGRALPPGVPAPMAELGVIPEDRRHDGLALTMSVQDNLLLKAGRTSALSPGGWILRSRWRAHAQALAVRQDVRSGGLDQPVASLSGGNQQKVVVARELSPRPRLVVAVNPTRGLDLKATAAVLEALIAARTDGAAVLLVHGDLDELLELADRVLVMSGGRLSESGWPQCTREHIGELMLGAASAALSPSASASASPSPSADGAPRASGDA